MYTIEAETLLVNSCEQMVVPKDALTIHADLELIQLVRVRNSVDIVFSCREGYDSLYHLQVVANILFIPDNLCLVDL